MRAKRRPASLTLRLTFLFGMAAAVVLSGLGGFIDYSIEEHFKEGDFGELKRIQHAVADVLAAQPEKINLPSSSYSLKRPLNHLIAGHPHTLLLVTLSNGRPYFSNFPGHLEASPFLQKKSSSIYLWENNTHTYRVLNTTAAGQGVRYRVSIAMVVDRHLNFLAHFRRTLWAIIVFAIIVMGLLGWYAVYQGYAPLYSIVTQIRHINAEQSNARLRPEDFPSELTAMALSFNEHLQRMETSFERLSNFSVDIAHELRTPVTNLMTQTQVALSQPRRLQAYQEVLYSNMEEYERLSQMIGDMLFIAKSDNGLMPPHSEAVNLTEEWCKLCEYYGLLAEEKNIALVLEGEARVKGDRLMLQRVLSNLISNAIRYTPADQRIRIQLHQGQKMASIEVSNPGKPLPPHQIKHLFKRFYRVDPSRQHNGEGVGLGLAIVKSIVEAHGGHISVASDTVSTRFKVELPVCSASREALRA